MRAVRIKSAPDDAVEAYSASNPPPSSALEIVDVPKPTAIEPGDVVVQIKATTIVRDNLTWPELFADPPAHLGNDFSGIVVEVDSDDTSSTVRPGDEVYGMVDAERGGTWAKYVLVKTHEMALQPQQLSWAEAAALPLSAQTADQALFDHAQLPVQPGQSRRVLVTGAAGGVGINLGQLAHAAGHYVVGATSSNDRNGEFLRSIGYDENVEYAKLSSLEPFDAVIDTVGGDVLRSCWKVIQPGGALISVDSASWDFVNVHRREGLDNGTGSINAKWFVVQPLADSLARVSKAVTAGELKAFVSQTVPFDNVRSAYDLCYARTVGRGKIVLTIES